ncbi:hypothetical protein HID58_060828 [Brassica napus]|uniref:Uncharacterized protein n=1 Tax=Brassica napus TaxID=3708 RepID=A0ABQ7ZWX8_BRANA|nr:hypothetical protein HID58_060828 [Brassica napus]
MITKRQERMPISQRVLKQVAAVPVVLSIVCFFFWPSIIVLDHLKGTKDVLLVTKKRDNSCPAVDERSLEFDLQGECLYLGVTDGHILEWRGEELGRVEFTCTSPHMFNPNKKSANLPMLSLFHVYWSNEYFINVQQITMC